MARSSDRLRPTLVMNPISLPASAVREQLVSDFNSDADGRQQTSQMPVDVAHALNATDHFLTEVTSLGVADRSACPDLPRSGSHSRTIRCPSGRCPAQYGDFPPPRHRLAHSSNSPGSKRPAGGKPEIDRPGSESVGFDQEDFGIF